jgi:hypothetical protein
MLGYAEDEIGNASMMEEPRTRMIERVSADPRRISTGAPRATRASMAAAQDGSYRWC